MTGGIQGHRDVNGDRTVTHPADGIYLSKFIAGIMASIITISLVGVFSNLWYLNSKAIIFDEHIRTVNSSNATLPGAVSREVYASDQRALMREIGALNKKIDELIARQDAMNARN